MAIPPATVNRKLAYVNDEVPPDTTEQVRAAADARNVEFVEVHAPSFDYAPEWQLKRGDLLFRPAVSIAAMRVEQFLYADGVATLYHPAGSIFFQYTAATIIHQRAGLPVPRTIFCASADRRLLRSYAERLGGFPLLVKISGYSRGIGVIRVDSLPGLFSVMDYLSAIGASPSLCAYVPDAVHWRLTVVGNRVVSAYRNRLEDDDFRTYASDEAEDYADGAPDGMADLAIRAVSSLHLELGGVDILAHPSGRFYLLEANFPAYFANIHRMGGPDVAGAIIDHLLQKLVDGV